MGQQLNRINSGGAAETKVDVNPPQLPSEIREKICRDASDFVLGLPDYVTNTDKRYDASLLFKRMMQIPQDIGKLSIIRGGSFKLALDDPENYTSVDAIKERQLYESPFGTLLKKNIIGSENLLLSQVYLKPFGEIIGYNVFSKKGTLYRIECDTSRKCTCTFKEIEDEIVIEPIVMRAATKLG